MLSPRYHQATIFIGETGDQNYQRRVEDVLQGDRKNTVRNTSEKAKLSQILQLLNQKLK